MGRRAACARGLGCLAFEAAPLAEVRIPGGRIDLARREVRFDDDRRIELSEREVELVHYLATNNGRAIARDELLPDDCIAVDIGMLLVVH